MSSKRTTLLEHLRTTLLPSITTTNGYANTLATVERGLRYPDALNESAFPAVFIAQTSEERKNLTRVHFQADLLVTLVGFVKSSAGISGAQIALDSLIEDLTKALEVDRLQGGRVNWTEIRRIRTDTGDLEPHAACAIEAHFVYSTEGTAP